MEAIYNTIGEGYNSTRKADPFLKEQILDLLQPRPENTYLDIGCGSGNYTKALASGGYKFIGIDPSEKMLDYAQNDPSSIQWMQGLAEDIPLAKNTMNGAIATLTLHHWTNIKEGFCELSRVLKPGSKLVILTSTPKQMDGYWLNHYFPITMENSRKEMPSESFILECGVANGFQLSDRRQYDVKDDLQDKFLYVGKNKPELYFDPEIRKGISSFSAFANAEDVEQGLRQLKKDVKSSKVHEIIKKFQNNNGDYLFLVLQKP